MPIYKILWPNSKKDPSSIEVASISVCKNGWEIVGNNWEDVLNGKAYMHL